MTRFGTWCIIMAISITSGSSAGTAPPRGSARQPSRPVYAEAWKQVKQLENDNKLNEANGVVSKILDDARAAGDIEDWTQAIVRSTMLQQGTDSYETALRFLMDTPKPDDPLYSAILHIVMAHSLGQYHQAYHYEIAKREKIVSNNDTDVRSWTSEEIAARIRMEYAAAWEFREALGWEPLHKWTDYFTRYGYPLDIRNSLRDFVAYAWAGVLANSGNWTPKQSNELFKVDLAGLIDRPAPVDVSDEQAHPIVIAMAVLDAHQTWHESRADRTNTLEVQLERIRLLTPHLQKKVLKERRLDALKRLADAYTDIKWGTVARYEYANALNSEGRKTEAYREASRGAESFNGSTGWQLCKNLIAVLEAPDFSLETLNADRPGEARTRITHRNVQTLSFRAFRVDINALIAKSNRWAFGLDHNEIDAMVHGRKPDAVWTSDLPDLKDYMDHQHEMALPMTEPGMYLVAVSIDPEFSKTRNKIDTMTILLTRMTIVRTDSATQTELLITESLSGKPIPNVRVDIHSRETRKPDSPIVRQTDRDGRVTIPKTDSYQPCIVVAHRDSDRVIDPQASIAAVSRESNNVTEFIYTDRSIYRPGQTVYYKVLAFEGLRGQPRIRSNAKIKVELKDENGESIAVGEHLTNAFGTTSGSFVIPSGRMLGGYSLNTEHGNTTIQVEEYKRPTFEVTLDAGEAELQLNREAVVRGTAEYYFGGNLTGGAVTWSVTRRTIMPWWLNWFFRFRAPIANDLTVGQGESVVDGDGSFEIRFLPESDPEIEQADAVHYRFEITAEVTDDAGETRDGSLNVNLGHCAVRTVVQSARDLIRAGESAEVLVQRESLDGRPMRGRSRWELIRLVEPATPPMPWELSPVPPTWRSTPPKQIGELPPPRWTDDPGWGQRLFQLNDGDRLLTGTLEHPESGKAVLSMGPLEPGLYRVYSMTEDASGKQTKSQYEFIVVAEKRIYSMPAVCLGEKASMKLGETAAFYVGSGFKDQLYWMEIWRDNTVIRREILDSNNGVTRFDIAADESMKGGFAIRVYLVHDGVLFQSMLPVYVPYHAEPLDVRFETFRDLLQPGQSETWQLKITGLSAASESAEILAYMFDRSLDYFVAHGYPSIAGLWPQRSMVFPASVQRYRLTGNRLLSNIPIDTMYASYSADRLNILDTYSRNNAMRKMAMRTSGGEPEGVMAGAAMPVSQGLMDIARDAAEPAPEMDLVSKSLADSVEETSSSGSGGSKQEVDIPLRENFSETAFFLPHLMTDETGAVRITFKAPDSVTSWNVFIHALTQDLRYAVAQKTVETRKDVMVRPYLPRYLREGDRADVKVMVNNTGAVDVSGVVNFTILDPETNADCAARFALGVTEQPVAVAAGKSATVTFPMTAPSMLGSYTIQVKVQAGDRSDGEQRALPVLPGRMHLSQSRFVTLSKDQPRTMRLNDLSESKSDPSLINESLVVTVDGQLVNQIIHAVPYLVEYPYECVEQTMNRFLGTGILNRIYETYPAIARAADACSNRETPLEAWREDDPNRKMALVETPWLVQSRGGKASDRLVNVLDRRTAKRHQAKALKQLTEAQNRDGSFPWWTGGPPSPFMTLYVVYSCAKAREFGIEEPHDRLIQNAVKYLAEDYRTNYKPKLLKEDVSVEFLVLLNYVMSCFENDALFADLIAASDRNDMLAYCFERWRRLSPQSLSHLALTLQRAGRTSDAQLLMASIMDRAVTKEDQGTFFAPEERAWLWYNDSIETHAAIMLALMEITPEDPRIEGLITWIFLNKKMNQWKSTRATAEVLYAIVTYLEAHHAMGNRQEAQIAAGPELKTFVFMPDDFDQTTQQLVIEGPSVVPAMSDVTVSPSGGGQMFASMTWHYSTEEMPQEARGDVLKVTRTFYLRTGEGDEKVLKPIDEGHPIAIGDQVEVQLSISAKNPMEYVHLMDPRAAGFEPEDRLSGHHWDLGLVRYQEIRDSCTNFFFEWLPQGEFTLKYRLRATTAGAFKCNPATLQSMYAPEFAAFSNGRTITIK